MKTKMGDIAVAEIIGAIILLAMAVAAFSVIYINVLSDDGPGLDSYATIAGKIENGHPIFEHKRGEGIGLNSKVNFINNGHVFATEIVKDIIESNDGNSIWSIGERLSCKYSEPGKEIQATIYDSITNELVWWGTLQEGGIFESLGARWYFDEGINLIAEDSLNNNDGKLCGPPEWQDQTEYIYNGSSALGFYGGDSVDVKGDTFSLNLIENLSVEAYFKFPENKYITSFGVPFGFEPTIIHINNTVYAVVYGNQSHKGNIKTVNISPYGNIKENIYKNLIEFETAAAYWSKICQVSDNIYVVVYADTPSLNSVTLKTLRIENNGTTGPLIGTFPLGFGIYDYEIIQICDNLTALIYGNSAYKGIIKTLNFSNNGTNFFNDPVDGTYEFESNKFFEPDVIRVHDNIYAIAYSDKNRHGVIKTVNITKDGVIHKPFISNFTFDTHTTYNADIKLVSNNIFVITYSDKKNNGHILTVEIADDGNITQKVNDAFVFENDICNLPKITSMKNDFFIVTYEGRNKDLPVKVIKIASNGSINHTFFSEFFVNDAINCQGETPDIIKISNGTYAIVFKSGANCGPPQEGHLITYSLSDAIDPYIPPINRGIIYKQDTWGIYVNKTHIVATIGNNHYYKKSSILYDYNEGPNNGWNHIILTYDKRYLQLYCNGVKEIFEEPPTIVNTNDESKDIQIGWTFHGFIDHVCIYDGIII